MFSPLLNIVMQYGGMVLAAVLFAIIYKTYIMSKMQAKIKRYQGEIVKSHARILELEATNAKLERRVKDVETNFMNESLVLN